MSPKGEGRKARNGKSDSGKNAGRGCPPVDKRFKPGQSGNPGGIPKATIEFRQRCREAMERPGGGWDLAAEMLVRPGPDRRWAIEFLAAYGYGKPSQHIEHTGTEGGPIEFIEVVRPSGDHGSGGK